MEGGNASSTRVSTVVAALVMLGTPWLGFWSSDRSGAAIAFSASNMALAPLASLFASTLGLGVSMCVARALGDRVAIIAIGLGPEVFAKPLSRTFLFVRAFPCAAFVSIITTRRRGQRARAIVAIGTSIASLITVIIVVVVIRDASSKTLRQHLATEIAWDTLLVLACGYASLWSVGAIESTFDDSAQKARLALGYADCVSRHQQRGAHDVAIAMARQGLEESPNDVMLQLSLALSMTAKGQDALPVLEPLVARTDLPAGFRPLVLNQWAWACYLRRDNNLRAVADDASREALGTRPNDPSFLDTRGHVLLWNARYDDAEQHLLRAYELAACPSTRASAAAGLAMVCVAKDQPQGAATWLQRSKEHDPDNAMIPHATAAVEPLRRL